RFSRDWSSDVCSSDLLGEQFSGSAGYSDYDFRDPMVVWNAQQQNYWMLITSRYNNQAAIGLYTSTDLQNWAPQAPLYLEDSALRSEERRVGKECRCRW